MNTKPSRKDVRDYYDEVYHPLTFSDRKPARDYRGTISSIASSIDKSGSSLLDVGCGCGDFIEKVQRGGLSAFGIDVSATALKHARHRSPASMFLLADGERLPFKDHSFSCIVANGSLEHFQSPERGLHELSRVARSDGLLLLSVPNARFWPDVLGLYDGTGQIQEKAFSLEEWSSVIRNCGFTIRSVAKDHGPPILKNLSPLGIIRRILLKVACLAPLRYSYQLIFLIRMERR